MKWAIFEFEDNTCEVGETSWIIYEDKEKFTNDLWLSSTEIVVKWPKDFGKISRKLGKTPIDINAITSTICTATIVKFNDHYETIRKHLENYLKTGDTNTPNKGRGHRVSKRNERYALQSDTDDEDSFASKKPPSKKPKIRKRGNDLLNMVKDKYKLGDGPNSDESSEDVGNQQEWLELRRENRELQQEVKDMQLEVKDMRQEMKDMRQVILNMKDLTNVNQAISDLTKTIKLIKPMKTSSTPSSSSSTSRASSPSLSSRMPSHAISKVDSQHTQRDEDNTSDEGTESNMVLLCPGIRVLKAQKKILDTCGDAKVFAYTLMEMLWSREVLATHSLTGKPSNAHKDKDPKPCLDQTIVKSLCDLVVRKYKLPEQKVKNLIKTKLQNVEKCEKMKKAMAIVGKS